MSLALRLSAWIDGLNHRVGRLASWMLLAMILLTVLVVVLRYFFQVGWIWLQDLIVYLHGGAFMLAAGYTLFFDEHVRVDIFYRAASAKAKACIDVAGVLLLLFPTCFLVLWFGWGYVGSSWSIGEGSQETGGLGGVYLVKSLILLFGALLSLQGGSTIIKAGASIRERQDA